MAADEYIILNADSGVAHYSVRGLTAEVCNVDQIEHEVKHPLANWPSLEAQGIVKCLRCWPRHGDAGATA